MRACHFLISYGPTILFLALSSLCEVNAELIAYWNQNNNSLSGGGFGFEVGDFPQAADSGSGEITLIDWDDSVSGTVYLTMNSFSGTTENALNSDPTGGSLCPTGDTNNGASILIQVSTIGFENISVSWAQRGSSTGFTSRVFSYSTDGTNFVEFGSDIGVLDGAWAIETYDLSGIDTLNDQSSVFLKITVDGASSSNGNNRFDNFQVNADVLITEVPFTVGEDTIATARIANDGPDSATDFYAEGNDNGDFSVYSIASFEFTESDFGLAESSTISGIEAIRLTLTHNDRFFTGGDAVEFFLTTDIFAGDFSALIFDMTLENGVNPADFSSDPISLGTFPYTRDDSGGGEQDTYSFDLTSAEAVLLPVLQSGAEFNIIIAAGDADDVITYSGLNNTFDPGNPYLELDLIEARIGGAPDITPPLASNFSPSDDSTDVPSNTNLSFEVDETVVIGVGNFNVFAQSTDALFEQIDVTAGSVVINRNIITVTLSSYLSDDTGYYVQWDSGILEDSAGNLIAALSDATTWNFETAEADLAPPALLATLPLDDAVEVVPNTGFSVTFDEAIFIGSGSVDIFAASDDQLFESIETGSISIDGATASFSLSSDLVLSEAYYVYIDAGLFEDASGNAYGGIDDETSWSFTVADTVPETDATQGKDLFAAARVLTSGPTSSADFYAEGNATTPFESLAIASFQFSNLDFDTPDTTLISNVIEARLTLTHNDRTFTGGDNVEFFLVSDVYGGDFSGLSFDTAFVNGVNPDAYSSAPISLGIFPYTRDSDGGGELDVYTFELSAAEGELLAALQSGSEFNIIMAAGDADDIITYSGLNNTFDPGNPYLELDVSLTEDAVIDAESPSIASLSPGDDTIGALINVDLVIGLDEIVELGTGNVYIYDVSTDILFEEVSSISGNITIDGGSVTIDLTSNLVAGTAYYIQWDAGFVQDPAGNPIAAVTDITTWNFQTSTPAIDFEGDFEVSPGALAGTVVGDLSPDLNGSEGFEYAIIGGAAQQGAMMKPVVDGYRVTPLFTAGDTFSGATGDLNVDSAGDYTPVGIFDGIGAYKLDDSTIRLYTNHELEAEQGYPYLLASGVSIRGARVSYFDIDIGTREIVDTGLAYDTVYDRAGNLVTSSIQINELNTLDFGFERMCSSSMYEPELFGVGRGTVDRIYFNGEEAAKSFGHPHGGTFWANDVANGAMYAVPGMGRGSWENLVQIDTGTTTHVAFALGDDLQSAPLYLYIGEKGKASDGTASSSFMARNGLAFGKLFVWKDDSGDLTPQNFFGTGSFRSGTFVEIDAMSPNPGSENTDALGYRDSDTLRSVADSLGAFSFARPEDLSADPSDGSVFAFASTGRGNLFPLDTWGAIYRVDVDFTDIDTPLASVEIIYDGDDQGGGQFFSSELSLRNPDNIDWADDGMIYAQEDRAGGATAQFASSGEEASIWQLDPNTGIITRITQMDRSVTLTLGSTDPDQDDVGNWESSGILDVSDLFGEPGGTLFFFNVQAHSITDGLINDLDLVQGSQLCLLEKTDYGAPFRINPNSGVIVVNDADAIEALDQSSFTLRVQAFDGITQTFEDIEIEVANDLGIFPASARFASFNIALSETGGLIEELESPNSSTSAQDIAQIIQINAPDVLLLNEFDYDADGEAIKNFRENYLEVAQNGEAPQYYGYTYIAPVNTGVASGFDLDNNGIVDTTEGDETYGDDAFGFGEYPGQYGMAVLSKYPIDEDNIRTFQKFLWKDMPGALLPPDPADTDGNGDLDNYFTDDELDIFRLSSKSHWDVPINIGSTTIHVLAGHPTPPVFDDGTETDLDNPTIADVNGRRNHDEIRFWADYIAGESYIYDDTEFAAAGDTTPVSPAGGLAADELFVIMGDYNADPDEGDSTANPAQTYFFDNPAINTDLTPTSVAGPDPDDTASFGGGTRVDYALPSANQEAIEAAVYWPSLTGLVTVSDHRLVRIDVAVPITEEDLAAYYASVNGLSGFTLQAAVHDLIDDHTIIEYGQIDELMEVIDVDETDDTQIRLIYSTTMLPLDAFIGGGGGGSDATSWNREHVWPRNDGVGDEGPDFSDAHHLFPAQVNVNSLRSALPFDYSQGITESDPFAPESTADGDSWEPLDRDKGMVARAIFYMATRYDGSDAETNDLVINNSPVFAGVDIGILDTLLEWNRLYPPSNYEKSRNNAIQRGVVINGDTIGQGNRNPFIDFPELADAMYLNQPFGETTTYEIAVSADPVEGGTVTGSGTYDAGTQVPVTAASNAGYRFDAWSGGTFDNSNAPSTTVLADSALTATATFIKTYDLLLSVADGLGGSVDGAGTYDSGAEVTITATPDAEYRFDSWLNGETVYSEDSTVIFNLNEDLELEAVFVRQYLVSATASPANGGTVSGAGTFDEGATVSLLASAESGFLFEAWVGLPAGVDTSSESVSFVIGEDVSAIANFVEDNTGEPTGGDDPVAQSITWDQDLEIVRVQDGAITLTGTASSGLALTYSGSDSTVASLVGDVLTPLAEGTLTVTAIQSGNDDFLAADPVVKVITVVDTSLQILDYAIGGLATEGDSVFFDVNAIGPFNIGYQWYKDENGIAGANSPTLSLDSVSLDDSGVYWVEVSDPYDTLGSSKEDFVVEAPINIETVFAGSVSVEDEWIALAWFGLIETSNIPWVYHSDYGYIYISASEGNTFWFHIGGNGWYFADPETAPYYYDGKAGSWIYLFTDESGVSWSYDFATGSWSSL